MRIAISIAISIPIGVFHLPSCLHPHGYMYYAVSVGSPPQYLGGLGGFSVLVASSVWMIDDGDGEEGLYGH